jgi:hypothetical protein
MTKKYIKQLFEVWIIVLLFDAFSFAQQVSSQGSSFFSPNTQYRPNVPGPENLAGEGLLFGIKSFINYVLELLAIIALVVLLW